MTWHAQLFRRIVLSNRRRSRRRCRRQSLDNAEISATSGGLGGGVVGTSRGIDRGRPGAPTSRSIVDSLLLLLFFAQNDLNCFITAGVHCGGEGGARVR